MGGPTAGDLVVVEEGQSDGWQDDQNHDGRGAQQIADGGAVTQNRQEKQDHGEAQEDALIGTREEMDGDSRAEQGGIARAPALSQPGQRSEHETAGRCANGSTPVAVHPLVEGAELNHRQKTAEQRPAGGGPGAQHPVAEGAHGGHGKSNSGPGMTENEPAERQHEAVPNGVNRAVGGLLEDKVGLKELGQSVGRVGQTEVAQSIGEEDVAELVGDVRRRNGVVDQEREPKGQRQESENQHAPAGPVRQSCGPGLEAWGVRIRATPAGPLRLARRSRWSQTRWGFQRDRGTGRARTATWGISIVASMVLQGFAAAKKRRGFSCAPLRLAINVLTGAGSKRAAEPELA